MIIPFFEASYNWLEQAKAYKDLEAACNQIIAYEQEFVAFVHHWEGIF